MPAYWTSASAVAVAVLAGVLFLNAPDSGDTPEHYQLQREELRGEELIPQRLASALAVTTVTGQAKELRRLNALLERGFPTVFQRLKVEKVNEHSRLLTWPGSDPSLRPVLLMSHMDVVPAPDKSPGAPRNWTQSPFSGTIKDGFLWGRGALDTKCTLTGTLEAVAQLQAAGFTPERTLLLAYGHDEEGGGEGGAAKISELLSSRGVELELVLDEGGMILVDGLKVGGTRVVQGPLALVGTAEKGLQDWRIRLSGAAGHSSVPPTGDGTSTAARLARILARLESVRMTSRLVPPVTDFFKALAPAARWGPMRTLLRAVDSRVMNPLLEAAVGQFGGRDLGAMVRTTVAIVGVHAGGIAHNVLPPTAEIVINFRTLPGDNEATVHEFLKVVAQNELPHASVERLPTKVYPASAVSPASGPHFDLVQRAILETLAPARAEKKGESGRENAQTVMRFMPVAPYLVTGMTDSRWYERLAPGRVFRFSPIRANRTAGDLDRIHGIDERLAVADYLDAVRFFMRFIKLATGVAEPGAEGAEADAAEPNRAVA